MKQAELNQRPDADAPLSDAEMDETVAQEEKVLARVHRTLQAKRPTQRGQLIDYDAEQIQTTLVDDARSCAGYRDTPTVTWINVVGLHDVELIRELGELFGVHQLVLEDIVTPHQRPRLAIDEEMMNEIAAVKKAVDRRLTGKETVALH